MALGSIKALASPERISQFGNILSDNYFDTGVYAAGCNIRDSGSLANMINLLYLTAPGSIIAQRDLDVQGSASLGTVNIVLSSKYSKTYNIPINGSVSDRTLIRAVRDATNPAQTQTNSVANQAMFDYMVNTARNTISGYTLTGTGPTQADFVASAEDFKMSIIPTQAYISGQFQNVTAVLDYGSILSKDIYILLKIVIVSGGSMVLSYSTDNVSYTPLETFNTVGTTDTLKTYTGKTFRYLKIYQPNTGAGQSVSTYIRELFIPL